MNKVILLITLSLSFTFASVATACSSSTYATTDNIRIISNTTDVHFPNEVNFSLEAETTVAIQEVSLFYKGVSADTWSYSYPSVHTGTRTKATFNLVTSGTQYLPSGADVVYYYTITDSHGRVTKTDKKVFTYLDDRFTWHTTQAGPLSIVWHDIPLGLVNEVASKVNTNLSYAKNLLNKGSREPIKGIIYNSMTEAELAFPNQGTQEQLFQGYAFPQWGLFLGVGLGTHLISHESAHLLLHQTTNAPGTSIPAWVHEGFACYIANHEHLSQNLDDLRSNMDRHTMPLRTMSAMPGTKKDIHTFYGKSDSVVTFMVDELGENNFRSFLTQLSHRKSANEALKEVYGFGIDELDKRWASGISRFASTRNEKTFPYWPTNSVLLGSLVLFVTTLIVLRGVFRHIRKAPELPKDREDDLL